MLFLIVIYYGLIFNYELGRCYCKWYNMDRLNILKLILVGRIISKQNGHFLRMLRIFNNHSVKLLG